jgi:hypothetical protein
MTAIKKPFVAERLGGLPTTADQYMFRAEIEGMDDDALTAKVVALRQELAKHDARYAAAREQWRLTGVYVVHTDAQLEESLRVRRELGMVEHHLSRRTSQASLAKYGSCPADWPVEGEDGES